MTFDQAKRDIKRGRIDAIRRALTDGLNPNLSNRFCWTLLMMAAMSGNVRIGELLVSHGANIHSANDGGETALSLAAHSGHERFVAWLVDLGASTQCRPHGWELPDWITQTSGLSREKIAAIFDLMGIQQPPAANRRSRTDRVMSRLIAIGVFSLVALVVLLNAPTLLRREFALPDRDCGFIQTLRVDRAEADANAALRGNDRRLLAVYGFTLEVPGLSEGSAKDGHALKPIDCTSDATISYRHERLNRNAIEYARRYNLEILRRTPAPSSP
jgi:hypothetical protein